MPSPRALLNAFLMHFTYVALVVLLMAAGVGVPVPEDIPLITAGYFCHPHESPIAKANLEDLNHDGVPDHPERRVPQIPLMIIAGMIGVLAGDCIVFSIGRRGMSSQNIVARHLRKVMHSKRRERVESHFARHGNLTVFCGRFLPGFRSIIFAFAGMSRMSLARFILIDGLAAAISVPIFIMLGFYFAAKFTELLHAIDRVKHIILPLVILAIVGGWIYWLVRKKKANIGQTPA